MRVLHICVTSHVTDGLSYQENLLSKYHKKQGHDVTLITSKWALDQQGRYVMDMRDEYVNEDGVKVIRLPAIGKEGCYRKFVRFRGFYQTLCRCSPEIMFLHNVSYRDAAAAAKYLRNHKDVTAYADNHGDFSNSATNWLSRNILHKLIWRCYARKLVPYVKKFYGVLPARVNFLTDIYGLPKEKCSLLVMGADDELVKKNGRAECRKQLAQELGIREDDFIVISGGKIDQWKRQTLCLMKAVKEMTDKKIKLVIFGSVIEELREEVLHLADNQKIFYIGWIDAKESYRYFAAADLAVFPGRHSVFWEQAAGQGIPMLCKDWAGTHHVDAGGNVRFISGESIEELKESIAWIAGDADIYQAMKKAAVEKGMKTFSYWNIAKKSIEQHRG